MRKSLTCHPLRSGNCGFLMHYQDLIRGMATVPVFLSSLVQAPTIASAIPARCSILVLTAHEGSFLASKGAFFTEAGIMVDDAERFVVCGLQDLPGFDLSNPMLPINTVAVTHSLLERIRPLLEANPAIRAILMECTELPHYSDALRKATGLLVFDIVTCINSFMEATTSSAWNQNLFGGDVDEVSSPPQPPYPNSNARHMTPNGIALDALSPTQALPNAQQRPATRRVR